MLERLLIVSLTWLDTTGNFNVNQNLLVTGNLNVSGTITSTSTTNISTNNKNLILANNQSTGSAVNGSGLLVGNATVASWLFNNATTSWQSNINIMPTNNNVWNLGGVSNYWNTVYGTTFVGTSTTAQYADVAEKYTSDAQYEPGTVVDFGGEYEVTLSNINGSQYVAGVVSTNPAYLMNDNFEHDNWLPVALTGRVPCNVQGPIQKGDLLVSSDKPGVAIKLDKSLYEVGCVIGKSLDIISDTSVRKIEIAVGRY